MQGLQVMLEERLERLPLLDGRILNGELLHAVREKEALHRHRMLTPQRPVVIEGGDALRWRNVIASALLRDARDEVDDGGPGCAFVPRRKFNRRHTRTPQPMQSSAAESATEDSAAPQCDERQLPPPASAIFACASSTVNVLGFWTGGNSLKVSMNFATMAWAAIAM